MEELNREMDGELSDEPGERWAPLGAASVEDQLDDSNFMLQFDAERLRDLEDQHEKLNSSLMALTSHFAQVQFRLKQIVDAPAEDKQQLLRQLEEFAFRGIPDIPDIASSKKFRQGSKDVECSIAKQKDKQRELIGELKNQLEELEHYAYEMGEAGLPQSVLVEKQQAIIDEFKDKLHLNVENMDRLTIDDLRDQVDSAIDQLVNPLKMKEQLVTQLKTQIVDLERFIHFLQADSGESKWDSKDLPKCMAHSENCSKCSCPTSHSPHPSAHRSSFPYKAGHSKDEGMKKTVEMIRRVATLVQLFTISQFGCGGSISSRTSSRFTSLNKTTKLQHWGDLRARLEVSVVELVSLVQERDRELTYDDYSSDNDSAGTTWSAKVSRAVRKQLAMSIKALMQHGLISMEASTSLVPLFGCFPPREREVPTMHAWQLILHYYELKNGPSYNALPVRKLSESFNLNIVGSTGVGHKQALLSTIGHILSLHTKFKRSYDAQFKAFICAALNAKKLVAWLRLIFRCDHLIDSYYEPWSYVARTKFDDSLQSLDKLSRFSFFLPIDTAVHHFQNIRDAF